MFHLRAVVILFFLLKHTKAERIQRRNEERKGIIRPRDSTIAAAFDSSYDSQTMEGALDLSLLGDFDDIDVIEVQLFPGMNSTSFEKRGRPSRNKIWYGENRGSVINLVNMGLDELGDEQIFGSVVEGNEIFHIRRDENGVAYVNRTRTEDYPPEGDPKFNEDEKYDEKYVRKLRSRNDKVTVETERKLAAGSLVEIDLMVVWSKQAECANSMLPPGCVLTQITKENMLGLVNLAIEETNTAYAYSGIDLELNLVHAYRHPTFVEAERNGFEAALDAVTEGEELWDVHHKRNLFGADLVATIIDDRNYCGLAWVGPQKSKGFSVTSWSCATGYFSFGHEISHNMGCNHDRGAKNKCGSGGYAYGFRDPDAEFRSILAYSCKQGQCDNNKGNGCTRVQRFSNTKELYNGKIIGTADSDNARQINDVKATIAAWYDGGTGCTKDLDCLDADDCTEDTCVERQCTYTDICLAPTTAPTLPFACDGDLEEFEMDMQMDGYPEDISWQLIDSEGVDAGAVVESGGSYKVPNERHVINKCVPDQKYEFILKDSYGDGFCCQWGDGSLKLSWKGEEVKVVKSFMHEDRAYFGGEVDVPRAPPLETSRPSKVPSSSPFESENPTLLPTTSMPSIAPSNLPSRTPSASPSESPSTDPTLLPTVSMPSSAPSNRPSRTPSASPSQSPSTDPTLLPTTSMPSSAPSNRPSSTPNASPSQSPSTDPTPSPSTSIPTSAPIIDNVFPFAFPTSPPSQTCAKEGELCADKECCEGYCSTSNNPHRCRIYQPISIKNRQKIVFHNAPWDRRGRQLRN